MKTEILINETQAELQVKEELHFTEQGYEKALKKSVEEALPVAEVLKNFKNVYERLNQIAHDLCLDNKINMRHSEADLVSILQSCTDETAQLAGNLKILLERERGRHTQKLNNRSLQRRRPGYLECLTAPYNNE